MTPERWKEIDEIVQAALERTPEDRCAFLDQACGEDETLRREVESLISYESQASGFLEEPALKHAADAGADELPGSLAGSALGHYRIERLIGAGGMGEVYLAQDTRLGRRVAVKVLPTLGVSSESCARFLREAQLASALDHPNICTIHEIGEDSGYCFIAMQFIEGETLKEVINSRPLDVNGVLSIGLQVADALALAHAQGIIHRDVKSSNIIITPRGQAKVLDFGLAKSLQGARGVGAGATATELTRTGAMVGTPAYMSPEQARGEPADHRSDIFSFGTVLYEMATGRLPFKEASPSETMNAIINKPHPPPIEINEQVPVTLSAAIDRALAKRPVDRYQSMPSMIEDLRSCAREVGLISSSSPDGAVVPYVVPRKFIRRNKAAVIAGLVIAAMVGVIATLSYFWISGKEMAREARTAPSPTMSIKRLTTNGKARRATISPDGKYVAHVMEEDGQQSLWVSQVATSTNTQIVPPAEVRYRGITFSHDGNFIYYARTEKGNSTGVLYQVPMLGGTARKLLVSVRSPFTLSPDGKRLAFMRGTRELVVANVDGTEETTLAARKRPDRFDASGPAWSPDGKVIACGTVNYVGGYYSSVVEVRVEDGAEKPITAQRWHGVGQLAWLTDGSGLVVTAIERAGSLPQIWYFSYPGGEARRITNDLNRYANISLTADSDTLVSVRTDRRVNIWVGPSGDASRARQLTFGTERYDGGRGLSWTTDGKIVYRSTAGDRPNIWIMEADGTGNKQLSFNDGQNQDPSVSPDGRYIVWGFNRADIRNIWRMDIDGGNPKQLTDGGGEYRPECSPDGKWVVYHAVGFGGSNRSLWKVSIDGGEPVQLTDRETRMPAISPDGKLIACNYFDAASARWKMAVIPFEGGPPARIFDIPGPDDRVIRWTPDGRALAYTITREGISNIWAQPLEGGRPKQLTNFKSDHIFNFAWSRDGKQLALSRGVVNSDVILISNFR